VAAASQVNELLASRRHGALADSVNDANLHLARLVYPGFVSAHGIGRLADVERYVRGIRYRLEHLAGGADRDRSRMVDVLAVERRYANFVDHVASADMTTDIAAIRWMLEELRIQVFAQQIGTSGSVSLKKINQRLAAVGA
jgi:ATP-dependent helicase HrpA